MTWVVDVTMSCTVPRFWFSRRWRLAVLCCVALLIITSQRISVDVALKSMLNQTASADNKTSLSHATDSVVPPSGDNVTGTNVSRDTACFNTTNVGILTTKIFKWQVCLSENLQCLLFNCYRTIIVTGSKNNFAAFVRFTRHQCIDYRLLCSVYEQPTVCACLQYIGLLTLIRLLSVTHSVNESFHSL